jgi:hypothetical protein
MSERLLDALRNLATSKLNTTGASISYAKAGRSVRAGESPDSFARAEMALGMISERHLFNGTLGPEMHPMT